MTTSLKIRTTIGAIAASVFAISAAFAGPTAPGKRTVATDDDGPDAAKLWAKSCTRCHNMRPAKTFSDAQWDAIVHHMRVRGNITGSDARLIVEFLKGAN